jgi:sporulation protein YlmC with PRC-barrel domain
VKPTDPIKLVSQLLDLPIVDKHDCWCGVVDDVELAGSAGKETRISALLVGPGAYEGRMPGWLFRVVRTIAGDRITRVPVEQIKAISSAVHLKCSADQLELHKVENRLRNWIPRWGAL